jgi:hypothetical protein
MRSLTLLYMIFSCNNKSEHKSFSPALRVASRQDELQDMAKVVLSQFRSLFKFNSSAVQ